MWIIQAKDIKAGQERAMTITGMDYFSQGEVVDQFKATHGKWFEFRSITHTHPLPLEQPTVTVNAPVEAASVADSLISPLRDVLASLPSEGGASVTADLEPHDDSDDTAFGVMLDA